MAQVTVIEWKKHWSNYDDDDSAYKAYHIGHSEHGGQISVYGSEDLMNKVLTMLNASPITYEIDEERKKDMSTHDMKTDTIKGKALQGRDDVIQELAQAILSLSNDNFDQAVKEIRNSYEKAVMLRAGLSTTDLASRKM